MQYIYLGKYKQSFRPIFITYANTAYLQTIVVKLTTLVLLVLNAIFTIITINESLVLIMFLYFII